MNRQQKEVFVQDLKNELRESKGLFLIGYKGLAVAQVTDLRKKLLNGGGSLQVSKLTLIRRAIDGESAAHGLDPYLKDQLALVFAHGGSSAVAKVLHDFAKTNNRLKVVAGCVDNTLLNAGDFAVFVSLPPREVLLGQVCGVLKAPSVQLVSCLKMLITRLVLVLKQIEQQKSS